MTPIEAMALLFDHRTQCVFLVEPELIVGRSPVCGLCIRQPYVSAQHATLRWTGSQWELKDLGSRNGTFLNHQRLAVGTTYPLTRGAQLAWGHEAERWQFRDDSAPRVLVLPLEGGEPLLAEHDVLGIPSAEAPQASIFRDADGFWKLETYEGEVSVVRHHQTFHAAGRVWRFSCPESIGSTSSPDAIAAPPLSLRFRVSRDEEHVELQALVGNRPVDLGCRSHNYLLLTLARARQADIVRALPDSACGWVYQDELLNQLAITASQLNIDVFRIRQHFARASLQEVVSIVERRSSTKQLRIGVAELAVTVL